MMIRRGSGRTPPFSLVGLLLILLILGFKCWTLSSQNADLQQDIEKFQAEIKISAMKQEQSENKNAALQQTVHDMDSISEKLKKKLLDEEEILKTKDQDNQKKAYEITSLKNKVTKMQEQINTLNQQLDDREVDLTKAKETNTHLATERDDALEAISEKDALINTLKRQLEQEKSRSSSLQYSVDDLKKKITQTFNDVTEHQDKISELETLVKILKTEAKKAQDEVAAVRREHLAVAKPNIVPGAMNLPNIEKKEPYYGPGQLGYISRGAVRTRDIGLRGFQFHHEVPILPRDPPNAPRKKPRFSVADMAKEPAASQVGANLVQGNGVADHLVAPQHIDQVNPNDANPSLLKPGAGRYIVPAPIPEFHGLVKPRHAVVTKAQGNYHPHINPVQGPAVVERPKNPVDNNRPIAAPIQSAIMEGQVPHNDVLAPPPHHLEDNLDAAIDEEEKIGEDLMDDQDEEGNDIRQNNDNIDEENCQEDNKDLPRRSNQVRALEIPQVFHPEDDTHQDMNMGEDPGNQGNYYEANLDNNIQNLLRPPKLP
ncbi:uncharacterized protein [Panulirus ornatus]|uniref:uncharacterized protein isoform X1 n=1 Tax=Panulirus ornatus TaxID=150431 RepID=UPI003A85D96A